MKRSLIALTLMVLAAGLSTSALAAGARPEAAGSGGARCTLPVFGPGATYHPTIHPSDFSPNVTNPYLPLRPGKTYVYAGTKDGKAAIDIFAPSRKTRVIDGVRTRVVNDRLFLNGVLEERTTDYYAQDRCGNVWYFGEDTATLDRSGHVVSRGGSFHAGVKGAQPGVFMQAHPSSVGCSGRSGRRATRRTSSRQSPRARASECPPARSTTRCAPRRPPRWSRASSTTSCT